MEAKQAFLNYERRLETDESTRNAFHVTMSNWINSSYLENIEHVPDEPQNFLTTFMVFKEGEGGGKGRMVVNGAKKFKGECLNDFLEPGGNVMNDLSELIVAHSKV